MLGKYNLRLETHDFKQLITHLYCLHRNQEGK